MTLSDLEREHLINWHASLFLNCCNQNRREVGREHWRRLVELIAQRSEAQVGRMERVFNDGTSGPGWSAAPQPAGAPSPYQVEDGAGGAR